MQKRALILLLCFLNLGLIYAQQSGDTLTTVKHSADFVKGKWYFDRFAYRIAIDHFKKAYEKDSISPAIPLMLTRSYYWMRDMGEAEYWARKTLALGYQPNADQLYLLVVIMASNHHEEYARLMYEQYLALDTLNIGRIRQMQAFLGISDLNSRGENYQIDLLPINSRASDFSPAFYKEGLVFVSGRSKKKGSKKRLKKEGVNYTNLWYTQVSDSGYSEPEKFSRELQSSFYEGPVSFYENDTKFVYTQSSISNKAIGSKAERGEDGRTNLKLFFADIAEGEITNIRPFAYNSEDFSTGHPTISPDGSKLIFASNRPESVGGTDLYISYCLEGDYWTPPLNLGKKINSSEHELFPYLNGDVLYFASDGHPGLGGLDIYRTRLVDDRPTEIFHFPDPVNSPADDFGIITRDDLEGYFASNREDPLDDNIYHGMFIPPPDPLLVNIAVSDSISGVLLLSPDLILADTTTGNPLILHEAGGDSIFTYLLDPGVVYSLTAGHDGYFSKDTLLYSGDTNSGNLQCIIALVPIRKDVHMELEDIFFDFNKTTLKEESWEVLHALIMWMEQNPEVRIEIQGHTDSKGPEEYNQKLSEGRARSVVDYLVESGIDPDRLSAVGYGESRPRVSCPEPADCSSDDHAKNRRTEMVILQEQQE